MLQVLDLCRALGSRGVLVQAQDSPKPETRCRRPACTAHMSWVFSSGLVGVVQCSWGNDMSVHMPGALGGSRKQMHGSIIYTMGVIVGGSGVATNCNLPVANWPRTL